MRLPLFLVMVLYLVYGFLLIPPIQSTLVETAIRNTVYTTEEMAERTPKLVRGNSPDFKFDDGRSFRVNIWFSNAISFIAFGCGIAAALLAVFLTELTIDYLMDRFSRYLQRRSR